MQDLGFSFKKHQKEYAIYRNGKKVGVLRGDKATAFQEAVESGDQMSHQQLMARLTGNYKHGNERSVKKTANHSVLTPAHKTSRLSAGLT